MLPATCCSVLSIAELGHRWAGISQPQLWCRKVDEGATDLLEVRHVPESIQLHGRLVLPQLTAPRLIQFPQDHLQAETQC